MFHRFKLLLVTIGLGLVPLNAAATSITSDASDALGNQANWSKLSLTQAVVAAPQATTSAERTSQSPAKPLAATSKNSPALPSPSSQSLISGNHALAAKNLIWLLVVLTPVGLATLYYFRRSAQSNLSASVQTHASSVEAASVQLPPPADSVGALPDPPNPTRSSAQAELPGYESVMMPTLTPTTRLAKIDPVEAMVTDLHNPDTAKRRKAIWDLGQQGDSRAVQPLVDLLVDSDSQQRSLILAAISEISTRTLKPMHRALLLSLQDENADVRKNAIRDVTRIYDLMSQVSQLLQYAASDTDQDVQETARWALGQLNRLRVVPGIEQPPHRTDALSLNSREQTQNDPT